MKSVWWCTPCLFCNRDKRNTNSSLSLCWCGCQTVGNAGQGTTYFPQKSFAEKYFAQKYSVKIYFAEKYFAGLSSEDVGQGKPGRGGGVGGCFPVVWQTGDHIGEAVKYYFADFVHKWGTPLPPFTDFPPKIFLKKGLKIVFCSD